MQPGHQRVCASRHPKLDGFTGVIDQILVADFGEEAVMRIGVAEQKAHFFAMDLPHSDAGFVKAYPAEATEAFCDGHHAAFAFLVGVPRPMLYDNTPLAVDTY